MRKVTMRRNIVSIFLLLPLWAIALPSDKTQPINFKADNAEFDHKKGEGVYVGHIALDQGTTHIRAAKVQSFSQKNRLVKAIAFGDKSARAHFQTIPEKDKPLLEARADKIIYDIDARTVDLVGHAQLNQDGDRMSAPTIHIDMKNQSVQSSGFGSEAVNIHYQVKTHEHT